jgi:hypothetical protein
MILDRLPPPKVVATRRPLSSSPDVLLNPRVDEDLAYSVFSPIVGDGEWLATAIV